MKKPNYKSKKGFTLIELLVVIGILAVLAAIAIPSVAGLIDRANVSADKTNSNEMTNAMERFASEYELYCQDIASNTLNINDLDSAQGRVYNVIGTMDRKGIELLEVDQNAEVGEYQVAIYRDTKYPANAYTAQLIIQNYTKSSSSSFEPKQSDMHYWYSPDCGVIVYAEPNADQDKENKLNSQITSGTDAKGNTLGSTTQWIDLTQNNTLSLFHDNIVPEGGRYFDASTNKYYTDGEVFPTPESGDTYTFGEYKYTIGFLDTDYYKGSYCYVHLTTNRNKTEYTPVLESVNGIRNFSLANVYSNCTNLTHAPKLPEGTIIGCQTFMNCTSLTYVASLPQALLVADNMFDGCTSLVNAPNMLKCTNLSNADFMFANCTSLTKTPDLSTIKSIDTRGMFSGCTNLVKVTSFPIVTTTSLNMMFDNCTSLTSISFPCRHYNVNATWQNCSPTVTIGNNCIHN